MVTATPASAMKSQAKPPVRSVTKATSRIASGAAPKLEEELHAEREALATRRGLGEQDVLGGQRRRVRDDEAGGERHERNPAHGRGQPQERRLAEERGGVDALEGVAVGEVAGAIWVRPAMP